MNVSPKLLTLPTRRGNVLAHDAYTRLGRVCGIAHRAEEVYTQELNKDE